MIRQGERCYQGSKGSFQCNFTILGESLYPNDNALQLEATTQFCKLLSIERSPPIEEVIQSGFVPRIAEFLMREDFPHVQDRAERVRDMGQGIDLATTLEHIEKNFVIPDPRFPDNPIVGCPLLNLNQSILRNRLSETIEKQSAKLGHKEWFAEVQFLSIVEHPNLVKLLGYCSADGERGIQRLLGYEYMPNESLEDHLFSRALPPIPWIRRLKILLGAAEGLAYLH
ncbi:concanavalin A-like lectin/glucanase domain, Ephrin receptor type-A /type-B [Artemisia annua]|uniref:Concanavalin A-like lectin/glucanase domain, Ephrin receptor type-A /type-B n=1 Tax=Artemisia annua TaxID=35608 RepID=A0A2U1P0U8_ARTAN|nr:concanavalin A-like lectin/glucanase domain, Ephrin receptor type-A /type-B [Artemisia annua]